MPSSLANLLMFSVDSTRSKIASKSVLTQIFALEFFKALSSPSALDRSICPTVIVMDALATCPFASAIEEPQIESKYRFYVSD
jgi:hypothetical protein